MEEDLERISKTGAHAPSPPLVSFAAFFSPISHSSHRRLSSNFSEPSCRRPISTAPRSRRLSWLTLQGRLVGAEEASSAKAIGGSLSRDEAVAWDLFTPIHRILIVAVVAVAAADSKKSRQIWQLRRSVDLRDQVLLSMQQKLDDLCEQVNTMKDRPESAFDVSFANNEKFSCTESTKFAESRYSDYGTCGFCYHHDQRDSTENAAGEDDMFKFKPVMVCTDQEERRMSDLSDLASSVTSAADHIQLDTLAIEQEKYNLQRECEEKDATIKELSAVVKANDVASSKRIEELEDIIRRKNMIITKQKKDIGVLEQKVVHLTRLRRSSSASTLSIKQLPVMADNLLYDMSSTSPSSSDSDSPAENQTRVSVNCGHQDISANQEHRVISARPSKSMPKLTHRPPRTRPVSPLTENSMNQRPDSPSTDPKRNRRRAQSASKETAQTKRWV